MDASCVLCCVWYRGTCPSLQLGGCQVREADGGISGVGCHVVVVVVVAVVVVGVFWFFDFILEFVWS